MIDHMAKPEEVLIVEDENGAIVREQTKDTEVIAQYKTMRDALVYLTHLNNDDTQSIMLDKLDMQVSCGYFTWNGLNTLCWAIGYEYLCYLLSLLSLLSLLLLLLSLFV